MACAHNHDCEDSNCAADWSLYKNVDLPKVSTLCESCGSWLNSETFCSSPAFGTSFAQLEHFRCGIIADDFQENEALN